MSPRKLILMGLSAFALVIIALISGLSASHQPRDAWPTTLELPSTRGLLHADTLSRGEAGHLSVLIPGFTHCPDICPLSLARLQMAWQRLDETSRAHLHPMFLTLDPARDTLPVLSRYLSAFSLPVTGLRLPTQDDTRLEEFTQRLGIQFQQRELEQKHPPEHAQASAGEADYMIDHSVAIFVIDEQGRLRDTLPLSQTPAQLADRLTFLLQSVAAAPSSAGVANVNTSANANMPATGGA
ncbi:SCO family protein [Cobetia sp. cqz5-12]|uniref:SCO family protein n=1 Tax=Cobetia sp. cqz5-12 TaxID=2609415 RepID=UPI00190600FD|nr:SCO family protein [Cobetia sp. cqz5-12]